MPAVPPAKQAVKVWASQFLPEEEIERYRPSHVQYGSASPEWKDRLEQPEVKALFVSFKDALLTALPDLQERHLKQVISFRKTKRIVCVIPQSDRLKLVLNMKFSEAKDPEGLCKDLTGKGHWGTGDVQVIYDEESDSDKVIALVKQAYRKWNPGT